MCNPSLTRAILSALEMSHDKALYKSTDTLLYRQTRPNNRPRYSVCIGLTVGHIYVVRRYGLKIEFVPSHPFWNILNAV